MMNKYIPIFLLFLSLPLIFTAPKKEIYDHTSGSIILLNPRNWDTQITNNRAKNVISFIHFYNPDHAKSIDYSIVMKELDSNNEGMFKFGAINCKEFHELCQKQNVDDLSSFMVYPPLPAPVMKYEGQLKSGSIVSYLGKFVENKALELNNNNFETFISENPSIPKILLFTDKKNVPLIFKKLSVHFDKKIDFGIVRKELSGVVSKYKVKTFPKIMAIGVDKKTTFYNGEIKYKPIFEFCNIYQETFFIVGEDLTLNEQPKKPWLNEKFPELRKETANDICFKGGKGICVLLIVKEKPTEEHEKIYLSIQEWLSPKINRGTNFKFAWVNSSKQVSLMKAMKLEKSAGPLFALLNHGTRDRFFIHEGELQETIIREYFDKLAGGDLRFNPIKMPEFDE